ncbi:MAG TPA: thrombospondin type 3 repeat-containing protein [Verrucomicrobiota bacterium]|nr:thrombospondin type 3 repeat-containing protein [Verrucomicrobiota bacterium]
MKTLFIAAIGMGLCASAAAATTINAANKHAYGANLGWLDWRDDTNSGAVIGEYVCSGYLYAANVGWIHLGNGNPSDGIRYQNLSTNDFGVNHDGAGNLRGFAYGANIGWIHFENLGAPKVNLKDGTFSGHVYSANCGWISLSNAVAFGQTDFLVPGLDKDGDGITDAWELTYTNTLAAFTNTSDTDGDGVSDLDEYLADTDPTDPADKLMITEYETKPGGTEATLTWLSKLTRCYQIEKTLTLTTPVWLDSGLEMIAPDEPSTTRMFADTNAPMRFYRVKAMKPLSP